MWIVHEIDGSFFHIYLFYTYLFFIFEEKKNKHFLCAKSKEMVN